VLRVPPPPEPYRPGPVRKPLDPKALAQLPSAADALAPKNIPEELLARVGVGEAAKAPEGLVAVLGGPDGHVGQVSGLAVSPDGKTLASAGGDKLLLWDLATGAVRHKLLGHQDHVYCVAFSADGRVLAAGDRAGAIKLWDPATGTELRTLIGHAGRVTRIAFSPDGRVLGSTGNDGSVRLWDAKTGKLQRILAVGAEATYAIAFSPDGKTVASGFNDGIVRLWNVESGWEVAALPGHGRNWIRAVSFSADGGTLASSCHALDPVRLWNLTELRVRETLAGHTSAVIDACWDASGRLLATASDSDGTVRVWDTSVSPARCKVLEVLTPGRNWLHAVTFTPDGRYLATANPDGIILILKLAERGSTVPFTDG
jgi:WD40 repeat protein